MESNINSIPITFKIEKKTFTMEAGTNAAGSFLRIIETVGRHHDMIVIPKPGLREFRDQLNRFIEIK